MSNILIITLVSLIVLLLLCNIRLILLLMVLVIPQICIYLVNNLPKLLLISSEEGEMLVLILFPLLFIPAIAIGQIWDILSYYYRSKGKLQTE